MGIEEDNKRLEGLDLRHIWHPFTQMKDWSAPVVISEGRGSFIKDTYGRWYLDGVSSIWVNLLGHKRKEIDEAVKAQIDRISHSTMLGLSSVPAIELAERLVSLLSESFGEGKLTKVFYSDNGSTAVEAALKMAFQYWIHKGEKERTLFVSLKEGYHGDTLGAVSAGGIDLFHSAFGPLLFKTIHAPSPSCYHCFKRLDPSSCKMECLSEMERALKENSGRIAAVIVEPVIQGAGGMLVARKGFLKGVRELCDKYDTLLIADEVATGFGRTGRMFACEHEGVRPDLICLSKGITGGYLPLAATVATEKIFGAFLGEASEFKTFFHGHSYTGNPLACSAAIACLDVLRKEKIIESLGPKIAILSDWIDGMKSHPHVGDARSVGLMAGVELVKDKARRIEYPYGEKRGWKVAEAMKRRGVIIRPIGNVIILMPPLTIEEEHLATMLRIAREAVEEATEK